MAIIRKEQWTETALMGLPTGENDNFERKSGLKVTNTQEFRSELGKQISAFANSGGGHLFLGVDNNGKIDGVPTMLPPLGKISMREWLEDLIPLVTDYPIRLFRVEEVEPDASNSGIASDQVVIAVNIFDSDLAPHQNKGDYIYYSRLSGKSRPAPHVFVDLLRHRPRHATLETKLVKCNVDNFAVNGLDITCNLGMLIQATNTSLTVTANESRFMIEGPIGAPKGRESDFSLHDPTQAGLGMLLPGTVGSRWFHAQLRITSRSRSFVDLYHELEALIIPSLAIRHRAISDSWAGTSEDSAILPLLELNDLAKVFEANLQVQDARYK